MGVSRDRPGDSADFAIKGGGSQERIQFEELGLSWGMIAFDDMDDEFVIKLLIESVVVIPMRGIKEEVYEVDCLESTSSY